VVENEEWLWLHTMLDQLSMKNESEGVVLIIHILYQPMKEIQMEYCSH